MQGKIDEAYDAFYKAAWNAAWQDASYFEIARIETIRGEYEKALESVEKSLTRNWHHHKARQLKCSLLRKMKYNEKAVAFADASLEIDSFSMGCRYERYLASGENSDLEKLKELMRDWSHGYIEYALDFVAGGLYEEAAGLLGLYLQDVEKSNILSFITYWVIYA